MFQSSKLYIFASIFFYFFQIYQNILNCIKYFTNIEFIHKILFEIRSYIGYSINNINNLYKYTKDLITYKNFNDTLNDKINILMNYKIKLDFISEYGRNSTYFIMDPILISFLTGLFVLLLILESLNI